MLIFDFKCECGEVFEECVNSETLHVRCKCGGVARRIISPVRSKLEGVTGHFPTAAMKWERMHENKG